MAQDPEIKFDLFQNDPKREMLTGDRAKELGAELAKLAEVGPIHALRFSGKSFGKEAAIVFADILTQVKGVTSVDFSDIIAGQETEEALEVLQIITEPFQQWQLEDLNLSDNALGYKGSRAIAKGLSTQTKLQRLYVCNDGLQAPAAQVLTDLLIDCQEDKQTELQVFETFNNLLESAGAIEFSRLFRASPHLKHLRFASTRVSSEGGVAIAEALKDRTNFEFLDISDNSYGEEAAKLLAETFFKNQPHLTTLKIGDCGMDEGIYEIITSLTNTAPELKVLDLQCSEIDTDHSDELATLLRSKPKLVDLNLNTNELGDKGFAHIALALKDHKDLEILRLCENELSARSVDLIVKYLLPLPSLKVLNLDGNGFSVDALEKLKSAFEAAEKDFEVMVGSLSDNDEDFEPSDEEALDLEEIQKALEQIKIED